MTRSFGRPVVGREPEEGPGPQILGMRLLIGKRVVNLRNEILGEIEEMIVDVLSGHVAYAVLAANGIVGVGAKRFAVPWTALQLDADDDCFVIDIDKRRLAQASAFDPSDWPVMSNRRWATEIHDYYQSAYYWTT